MGFQDLLKSELAKQDHGDRENVVYPYSKLKNQELFFPKAQGGMPSSLLIRILPPAVDGENYVVQDRELFMQTRNANGKDIKLKAVLSAFPNREDELDVAITDWQARNMVPNMYNRTAKPSSRFLANVVQIVQDPQTGQYTEERDEQGNLVVRMMKIPYSAYSEINTKLVDGLNMPQALKGADPAVAQYSFISSQAAYPILITKPQKGSGSMSYSVQLYPNIELGPLPEGWEDQLEDLAYQATPSIEYNRDYVEYFISVVNGEETQYQQGQGQGTQGASNLNRGNYANNPVQGPQQQYGAPVGQSSQPKQPTQGNWPPEGMTGGQRQQLQQQRQGQVPPTQPQQPVVTDDMLPQDLVDMPNVPNQGAPVQPPVQGQGIPQGQQFNQPVEETYKEQPQVSNGLPDVNELLKGMQ